MDRLEDPRAVGAGREVDAGRHAHAAVEGGGDVGEDVPEEVGRDDIDARRAASSS